MKRKVFLMVGYEPMIKEVIDKIESFENQTGLVVDMEAAIEALKIASKQQAKLNLIELGKIGTKVSFDKIEKIHPKHQRNNKFRR